MKLLYFSALLLFCSSAHASEKKLFDKLSLQSGFTSDIVEGNNIKTRVLGYQVKFDVTDKITSNLEFFLKASANLETGSNEVIGSEAQVEEFDPNQSLNLEEGGIYFNGGEYFDLKVGALNQGKYHSPLLVSDIDFAATEQKLTLGWLYLKAQQAIPSNSKLTKRIGTVKTGTPQFLMNTLGLKLGQTTTFELEASYFKYADLSSNIAEKSLAMGNSTSGQGNASKFNYQFEGVNVWTQLLAATPGPSILLRGQYLYNDKAPNKRNTGHLMNLGFKLDAYTILMEAFRNETDTAPAFYNSKYYGHNNMQGSGAILKYESKVIEFKLRYAHLKPIEDNNIQEKMEILTFRLFKNYSF